MKKEIKIGDKTFEFDIPNILDKSTTDMMNDWCKLVDKQQMSNSSKQGLFCQTDVSGSFYWTTQYYHHNNSFTMEDFLDNHLPEGAIVHHIEGSYAEVEYEGRDIGIHAGGNGDSYNHVIRWEVL